MSAATNGGYGGGGGGGQPSQWSSGGTLYSPGGDGGPGIICLLVNNENLNTSKECSGFTVINPPIVPKNQGATPYLSVETIGVEVQTLDPVSNTVPVQFDIETNLVGEDGNVNNTISGYSNNSNGNTIVDSGGSESQIVYLNEGAYTITTNSSILYLAMCGGGGGGGGGASFPNNGNCGLPIYLGAGGGGGGAVISGNILLYPDPSTNSDYDCSLVSTIYAFVGGGGYGGGSVRDINGVDTGGYGGYGGGGADGGGYYGVSGGQSGGNGGAGIFGGNGGNVTMLVITNSYLAEPIILTCPGGSGGTSYDSSLWNYGSRSLTQIPLGGAGGTPYSYGLSLQGYNNLNFLNGGTGGNGSCLAYPVYFNAYGVYYTTYGSTCGESGNALAGTTLTGQYTYNSGAAGLATTAFLLPSVSGTLSSNSGYTFTPCTSGSAEYQNALAIVMGGGGGGSNGDKYTKDPNIQGGAGVGGCGGTVPVSTQSNSGIGSELLDALGKVVVGTITNIVTDSVEALPSLLM